jgi:hypothetical protein
MLVDRSWNNNVIVPQFVDGKLIPPIAKPVEEIN